MTDILNTSPNFGYPIDPTNLAGGTYEALRKSNALFRRTVLELDNPTLSENAPTGELRIANMPLHSKEFVAFAVRAVAYAEPENSGDPLSTGERGELWFDGKRIDWNIQLQTKCGTLKSAKSANPSTIPRTITINFPDR